MYYEDMMRLTHNLPGIMLPTPLHHVCGVVACIPMKLSRLNWSFFSANSMPQIVTVAVSNHLNPIIDRIRCLIRRRFCSTTLFKYIHDRNRTRCGNVPAAFSLATARCQAAYPSKGINPRRYMLCCCLVKASRPSRRAALSIALIDAPGVIPQRAIYHRTKYKRVFEKLTLPLRSRAHLRDYGSYAHPMLRHRSQPHRLGLDRPAPAGSSGRVGRHFPVMLLSVRLPRNLPMGMQRFLPKVQFFIDLNNQPQNRRCGIRCKPKMSHYSELFSDNASFAFPSS
jgi:hypothetical protein